METLNGWFGQERKMEIKKYIKRKRREVKSQSIDEKFKISKVSRLKKKKRMNKMLLNC